MEWVGERKTKKIYGKKTGVGQIQNQIGLL